MTRLLLLAILALVTWVYFPETRAILLDVAEPVVVPLVRWGAEDEMAQVGRNVVAHERLTGQLPTGASWLAWLEFRYTTEEGRRDPWGSVYQIETSSDSVWILSYGPDRIRATEDDFHVVTARDL